MSFEKTRNNINLESDVQESVDLVIDPSEDKFVPEKISKTVEYKLKNWMQEKKLTPEDDVTFNIQYGKFNYPSILAFVKAEQKITCQDMQNNRAAPKPLVKGVQDVFPGLEMVDISFQNNKLRMEKALIQGGSPNYANTEQPRLSQFNLWTANKKSKAPSITNEPPITNEQDTPSISKKR